jgi:hypothetical protein
MRVALEWVVADSAAEVVAFTVEVVVFTVEAVASTVDQVAFKEEAGSVLALKAEASPRAFMAVAITVTGVGMVEEDMTATSTITPT